MDPKKHINIIYENTYNIFSTKNNNIFKLRSYTIL